MRIAKSIALAALVAAACGSPARREVGTPEQASEDARFAAAADAFYDAHLRARPTVASGLGYHEHDGKLPDVSPDAIAAEVVRLTGARAELEAFDPARLSKLRRVEREVLLAEIRSELFELDAAKRWQRDPIFYLWSLNLSGYVLRDYAPLADRARGLIALCDAVGPYLAQARANLQPRIPRPWLQTALLVVNGLIEFAGDDARAQMAGLPDEQRAELHAALDRYAAAVGEFRDFLAARMADATDDYALGEQMFLRMLADVEGLTIDLERLEEIGRADLERNLRAMDEAARAIDPGKPTREVVDLVSAEKPAADQVLATATRQSADMRQFLIDHHIVTIPSDDAAEVRESPSFMRFNSAFLSSPGVFETAPLPAFYYISPPDPSWPPERQQGYIPSYGNLLFTSIHELWPGHFLHYLHKKRNESRILKSFCTYSMSEGWAHYAEEMMWDAGAGGGDPRMRIGQLGDALLRNVRYMSAIGLHTRGMSVEESIAMFRDKAFSDEGTARQQAVRGTFDPGYLNYTLGKLMIRKLRDDWKAKMGDRYSLQAFHDEFLSYGCAPVPVIRRAMLGDDAGPAL